MDTAEHHSSAARRRRERGQGRALLLIGIVFVEALLLRTQQLANVSLWFDEACSWKISQFHVPEMLDAVSRDAHPPVYYFVLKGWEALGGGSPAGVRWLSVLLGVGTVMAAYWFTGTALSGGGDESTRGSQREFGAVLAAQLVAASALHVEMSLQARPYTLATFLAVVSGGFLLRAVRPSGRVLDWALFALTAAALSLTHYYGLFTVAAELLFAGGAALHQWRQSGWSGRTKRLMAGAAISAWGIQLAWVPWLPVFQMQLARANDQLWMRPLDWESMAHVCFKVMAGGRHVPAWEEWTEVGLLVWGITVAALLCSRNAAARLAALAAGLPLAAVVAYGVAVRNILGVCYLVFAHVFLLIGWAILISRVPVRTVQAGLLMVAVSWSGWWCWKYGQHREFQSGFPGVQAAVAFLERSRTPDEPVVVCSPFVHTIIHQHARQRDGLYLRYSGDHRRSILGGPPLRDADYEPVEEILASGPPRLWTVDAIGLFEGIAVVDLPDEYRLVTEERFPERFGHRMDLLVREYVRDDHSDQNNHRVMTAQRTARGTRP